MDKLTAPTDMSTVGSKGLLVTAGDDVFQTGHIVYTVISMLAIMLLTVLLTLRFQQFYKSPVKALHLLRCITIFIYVTAIGMIFTLAFMYNGIGLTTTFTTCRSSIVICFIWYGLNRAGLIFFFIERAHNIRSSELERRKDWIWIVGSTYTGVICMVIFVLAMGFSTASFGNSTDAPECRIGIPNHWLITLAAAGALNDFMVFGIYLWLLRPLTGKRFIVQENVDSPDTLNVASPQYITLKSQTGALRSQDSTPLPEQITSETPAIFRLKALIKKSIFGLCMMIPMETFNFVYFIVARGMEMGWVCFTICTVDVVVTTCVIHWLTKSAKDTERSLRHARPGS